MQASDYNLGGELQVAAAAAEGYSSLTASWGEKKDDDGKWAMTLHIQQKPDKLLPESQSGSVPVSQIMQKIKQHQIKIK